MIPAILALVYIALLVSQFGASSGSFNSLACVSELFSNRWVLLAGWIHYLAFDLFIGGWQVRNAAANGVPRLMVFPCLLLTFLFGPVGLLLYLSLRTARTRRISGAEGWRVHS